MPHYSIQQINIIIQGEISGDLTHSVQQLIIDSRRVTFPESSLFFAIKGIRHDGHKYINDVYAKGVRCFVVEDKTSIIQKKDTAYILVDNSLSALQKLAGWHRRQFHKPVIAITGSNGKTVVKEWIYQMIRSDLHVVRSPKSYNSQVGVPLSLWQIESQHDIAIIEAGISMPGEMEKLEAMILPDIGIFTNLGDPHRENFLDQHQKCAEKLKLFKHCKKLIYSKDIPYIEEILGTTDYKNVTTFCWSKKSVSDLQITNIIKENSHSIIHCLTDGQIIEMTAPFVDDASIENVINLIALLLVLKYNPDTIRDRIKNLGPVEMRLELKEGINHCTVINDSYNSDLGSLAIALDYLAHQHQNLKKTVILSDILQSGKNNDQLYAEASNLIGQKSVNQFIGIGQNLMSQKHRFAVNSKFFLTTSDFLDHFTKEQFDHETILLKGSRTYEFERILKVLEEKVHETVLEINLNAMVDNLNYFRSLLHPETKIIVMVKAFSYGNGSFEIANLLQFQQVDYLAVAFTDEGIALREAGITTPIIVMNPEKNSFDAIIHYQLEPEMYNFRVITQFIGAVEKSGYNSFPVHIKLDTGMHRLGFTENEIDNIITLIKNQPYLQIKSVFSHLAGSEESQFDEFTRKQISLFDEWSKKICNAFPYKIWRHILNSAGIERFNDSQFDMVRLGIGLYGLSAINQNFVKQVSTLKTIILQIKYIDKDETVGYSRKFKAEQLTRIGIIPIGYADGLHRILGNERGKLMVKNQLVPIIGNISMDMTAINLTGVDAAEGDPVIVFGEHYPITEISKQMDTIPYEVLTSISRRVKRVYFQE